MTYRLVPFHLSHVADMQYDLHINPRLVAHFNQTRSNGPAFTLIADERVVGAGGVVLGWEGLGDAWAVLAPNAPKILVTRMAKSMLQEVKRNLNLRRIQTFTLPEPKYGLWVEALGFRSEGTLHKYGPNGEDFMIWALL